MKEGQEMPPAAEGGEEAERLEWFRQEMQAYKEAEERGERETAHLRQLPNREGLDVSKLTAREMRIWELVRQETITEEDFRRYRDELLDEEGGLRPEADRNIAHVFLAFIANKANPIFVRRKRGERHRP